MERPLVTKIFILTLIAAIIYACYHIFRPFLVEIIAAAIFVSVFYRPYEWLARRLGGRRRIASLAMCILIALVVIIPLTNFLVYAAQRSVVAFEQISTFINDGGYEGIINHPLLKRLYDYVLADANVKNIIIEMAKKVNDWFVSGAATVIKGTTNFFISLALIIFTMFFFFIDGPRMVEKIMSWTPLPERYDKEIFNKFRNVSLSTVVSTLVTAMAQGLIGAIGFMIAGVPAFFAGVAMGFLSLLPYVGAAIIWFPTGVILILTGKIWQGIVLLVWGAAVVSTVDNVLRAYLIKGKAQVHPIFIIFSILGGISLFGFWGIVFGPLIISMAVTILHIYEIEYANLIEK